MRLGVAALVVAAGCTQVFGLDKTRLEETPAVDASPPPSCPAPGGVPTFGIELAQIDSSGCRSFTFDATQTVVAAICNNGTNDAVYTGTVGEPLIEAPLSPAPEYPLSVRMSPEADLLLVNDAKSVSSTIETIEYTLASGTWVAAAMPTPLQGMFVESSVPSTPSRGPVRRVVISRFDAMSVRVLAELERDPVGMWTTVSETPIDTLGMISLREPQLSSDGLRLVFLGQPMEAMPPFTEPVFYADRMTLAEPFGAPRLVATAPDLVEFPHLTDDCGRIYFSALDRVWYLSEY